MIMEFTGLVRNTIEPMISQLGFMLLSETPRALEYASPFVRLRFSFNQRENSLNFFLGPVSGDLILFDDDILEEGFESSGHLDQVAVEVFLQTLLSFYENEGRELMRGSDEEMQRLLDYQEERSAGYTARLREAQR